MHVHVYIMYQPWGVVRTLEDYDILPHGVKFVPLGKDDECSFYQMFYP